MLDLNNQVAIVTGSTKGIGRAIAQALYAHGARVTVSSRTSRDVEQVAAELAGKTTGSEARALGVPADVRRPEDCRTLVSRTVNNLARRHPHQQRRHWRIQSGGGDGPEHWRAVIETNLNSLFYCSHAVIPHMKAAGGGWIINIGSLAGKNAFAGGAAYNASKFGLIGFSEALMQEVRHDGIRVSSSCPAAWQRNSMGRRRAVPAGRCSRKTSPRSSPIC